MPKGQKGTKMHTSVAQLNTCRQQKSMHSLCGKEKREKKMENKSIMVVHVVKDFTWTLRPTKFTSAKANLPCSEEAMVVEKRENAALNES